MKHTFGFFIGYLPKTFKKYLIIIKQQKSKQFSRLRVGQATIEYFLVFCVFAAVAVAALVFVEKVPEFVLQPVRAFEEGLNSERSENGLKSPRPPIELKREPSVPVPTESGTQATPAIGAVKEREAETKRTVRVENLIRTDTMEKFFDGIARNIKEAR